MILGGRRKIAEGWLLLLVTVLALAVRLPYWRTIPAAGDEVGQAVYAFNIVQGRGLPLVGNDEYAGPFFFYLLALLFRLGVADPLVGRTVVLIAGTLTATVTYAWVRELRGDRRAGLVAALLVAINPHLILLNSHVGGTTFLLPFFTTVFLWLLVRAVEMDRPGWLVAAAIAAGLAIQSNPVAGLLIAGGWAWVTLRTRRAPRLGRHWPLWPAVGGLCLLLVYAPVIVYNVQSGLDSVSVAGERAYLWQADPTLHTFLSNLPRMALQLVRQMSGVLMGDETFRTLLGVPLIYLAWMVAALVFVTRRVSPLPIVVTIPYLVLFPYSSSHYGLIAPVRFTSLLTPVFAAAMGFLFASLLERARELRHAGRWAVATALLVVAVLAAYPPVSLFRYYTYVEENDRSGRVLLALSRRMVEQNRGEPVYIEGTDRATFVKGIPYVPHAYLLFADIRQEFLPPQQIVGRLFAKPGPATLLLSDEGAAIVGRVAGLTRRPGAANEEARRRGYGLYSLETTAPLVKPEFVWVGERARGVEPQIAIGERLGGGVELVGCDVSERAAAGSTLELTVYWRAVQPMAEGTYVGFVHLLDPAGALLAQDDHVLGRERYPLAAWQPDEVVVERYSLPVPEGVAAGRHSLWAGIYAWPDLIRLEVSDHPDDLVELGFVAVE